MTTCVNKVNSANPQDCLEEMKQMLEDPAVFSSDIIVFPKLALCSPSCGSLLSTPLLGEQCMNALDELCLATADCGGYIIVGLTLDDWGQPVSAMGVLYRGALVALIPTTDNPAPFANSGFSENLLPFDSVFACGELRFCIVGCELATLPLRAAQAAQTGCDLIIVPTYSPVYAGLIDQVCEGAKVISSATGCAIAVVNGGIGDTSFPHAYQGFCAAYECGTPLARQEAAFASIYTAVDLDVDIIRSQKKISGYSKPLHRITPSEIHRGLRRPVNNNPFLPAENQEAYLDDLFALQVRSLTARMENVGITKLVVGVSGGLDSTAALLVCVAAVDALGLPRQNIVAVTMPGFGTSDRTYFNALRLIEELEVTGKDISIRQSVTQHFEDIGHSGQQDTTFENAQARERAQILLDLANAMSAIVVGSGDLSEEALGFCTFGGDHIASYNVNNCITKTVLRQLVAHLAAKHNLPRVTEVLEDVLDTPISPELLPLSQEGEIVQKTETILGPYLLHDFFLYYFIRYRFRPFKLFHYACIAFSHSLEPSFIREKLELFIKRFCAAQFKRSCAPDSASITQVNLCGINYSIPSDLDPTALLADLEQIS